jgi:hypothetical protein
MAGVFASAVLAIGVWQLQQWHVDNGNRKWLKDSITAELSVNILKLRQVQVAVQEAGTKGITLAQYFPFYLDLNVYSASVNSGNLKLLAPPIQGRIHGAYSNFQKFNTLLANVESFAIYNVSALSFRQELNLRSDMLSRQAGAFAGIAEETLKDLGGSISAGSSSVVTMTEIPRGPASAKYAVLQLVNESDMPQDIDLRAKGVDEYNIRGIIWNPRARLGRLLHCRKEYSKPESVALIAGFG